MAGHADFSMVPPTPHPSRGLACSAGILIAGLISLAFGCVVALMREADYAKAVLLWPPAGVMALALARLIFLAVFRQSAFAAAFATITVLTASVLTLGAAAVTAFGFFNRLPWASVAFCGFTGALPIYLLIFAAQLEAWSQRLRYYHARKPRCPNCDYDLIVTIDIGHETCPECGTAIPRKVLARYRRAKTSKT